MQIETSLNLVAGVISGALLYIRDEFKQVDQSSFLQVNKGLVFDTCGYSFCRLKVKRIAEACNLDDTSWYRVYDDVISWSILDTHAHTEKGRYVEVTSEVKPTNNVILQGWRKHVTTINVSVGWSVSMVGFLKLCWKGINFC